MSREQTRNGLKKFLSKTITYEATYDGKKITGTRERYLVLDIKEKGKSKILSDHLWLGLDTVFEEGQKIEFLARAHSYIDAKKQRKYNLTSIRSLRKLDIEKDTIVKLNSSDRVEKIKRKYK